MHKVNHMSTNDERKGRRPEVDTITLKEKKG